MQKHDLSGGYVSWAIRMRMISVSRCKIIYQSDVSHHCRKEAKTQQ